MYTSEKKVLSIMTYFALIAFMVTFVVFMCLALLDTALPLWARITYYVWIGVIVLDIIFDIVCTFTGMGKFCSGLVLYILTFATIIMGFVLGGSLSVGGIIPTDIMGIFGAAVALSYAINILAIIIYCLGEKIVVIDDAQGKKRIR